MNCPKRSTSTFGQNLNRWLAAFFDAVPGLLPRAIGQLAPLSNIALPVQPCIRDIWHDHVLFTGDEVTGIIDFGAMDIDTPATDVARLLGSLVGDDEAGWRTASSAYSADSPAIGGRRASRKGTGCEQHNPGRLQLAAMDLRRRSPIRRSARRSSSGSDES